MKRGALLGKEPRVDQKVFAAIGSPDFASTVSVVFSGCYPATVSDFETVFLCPLNSSAAARQPLCSFSARPTPLPDAGAFAPKRGRGYRHPGPHWQPIAAARVAADKTSYCSFWLDNLTFPQLRYGT